MLDRILNLRDRRSGGHDMIGNVFILGVIDDFIPRQPKTRQLMTQVKRGSL